MTGLFALAAAVLLHEAGFTPGVRGAGAAHNLIHVPENAVKFSRKLTEGLLYVRGVRIHVFALEIAVVYPGKQDGAAGIDIPYLTEEVAVVLLEAAGVKFPSLDVVDADGEDHKVRHYAAEVIDPEGTSGP